MLCVQAGVRTYLYKMISDRGGAPCAPEPKDASKPWLTLALCKPAIRRTAQAGDRLLAVTSRALQLREGYPAAAVIYAATVSEAVDARAYYARQSPFRTRPDCVYHFWPDAGEFRHTGRTALHATPESMRKDLGRYPVYRNGRVLICEKFRYFGAEAVRIPETMPGLLAVVSSLGQGHRVFERGKHTAIDRELGRLFGLLARRSTRYTPWDVEADAYEHRAFAGRETQRPVGGSVEDASAEAGRGEGDPRTALS